MILWWHWVVLGVILLVADIALINLYYLMWFGVGAFIVGGGVLIFPAMPLWFQILLFGGISAAFLALWLLVLRPHNEKKLLATAKEELIGAVAVVVRFTNGRGTLRLQKPIGGRDTWRFTSSETPTPNDSVVITALDDNGIAQAKIRPPTPPPGN